MKQALFIGAIASILTINSVMADTTVTSKQYVDTTRQATIPATGTNAATPGTTVVTYTNTAGTIGERGIFNPATDFNFQNNTIAPGHEGDLVTADIYPAVGSIYNELQDELQEIQNNMPEGATCYEWMGGECILVNMPMAAAPACVANGDECWGDGACCSGYCIGCRTTPCERAGQCGWAS